MIEEGDDRGGWSWVGDDRGFSCFGCCGAVGRP